MEIHTICLNWSILRKKNNWLLRGKELSLGVGMQKRNIYNWNKRWEIKHIWEKLMVPEPRIILWGHCAFCFLFLHSYLVTLGFPGGSDGKESACSAGDMGLIPGSGRSPGEGNDNPLQYSCLENPMDGGAWQAIVHEIAKSGTWLRDFPFFPFVAQLVKSLPVIQEMWVWSLGREDSLEKGNATHSSILAWRIPWTVQAMGSQRVGHDWATFTFVVT